MDHATLRMAARLAHPWSPENLSGFDDAELEAAASILARQKVCLMGLRRLHGNDVMSTPLAPAIDADRNRYRAERGEYERIRQRFVAKGVRSMLFKSTGMFPSFHYLSSNLDVIVPDGQAPTAREVLRELGYVELLNVEEPKKFLFRRFPGDGSTFAFHLHEVVGWGVPFVDNQRLWDNARVPEDEPDILVPGPVEALLITCAHWFYEDKALSLGNLFLTAHALHELPVPLAEAAKRAAERGWEEGFWGALFILDQTWHWLYQEALLTSEQRDEVLEQLRNHRFVRERLLSGVTHGDGDPATIPFLLNKVVYYRKILRDPQRTTARKLQDVVATLLWAVRWKLHLRPQKRMLVSVSGCDGSGKSLQIGRLCGVLDHCDLRYRVVWARGMSSPFAAFCIRIGKMITGGGGSGSSAPGATGETNGGDGAVTEDVKFRQRRSMLGNPLTRFFFALVYAVEMKLAYVIRARLALLTGNIVVCDRYLADAFVDFSLYAGTDPKRPPWPLQLVAWFSPRPKVAFLLDVEPEEALRRKPEEGSTEHLQKARDGFLELASSMNLTVMPGDQDADTIARAVAVRTLDSFYEKYGTMLNALLFSNPGQLNPRHRRANGD